MRMRTGEDTRKRAAAQQDMFFYLASAAISAHSSLQKPVALSSCEAEYYALSAAWQEAVFLRALLDEGGMPQGDPTIIREDNWLTRAALP
jgi:hypothetical protein